MATTKQTTVAEKNELSAPVDQEPKDVAVSQDPKATVKLVGGVEVPAPTPQPDGTNAPVYLPIPGTYADR